MPYRQHTFDNTDQVQAAAAAVLEEFSGAGTIPVLLVPTTAALMRTRRAFADGACSFGVRVETPAAWIADRWELFGDGQRMVDPGERELLLQRACEDAVVSGNAEGCTLSSTPGTIALLARLAREALPALLATDGQARARLSAAERATLAVLGRYASLLADAGLCEISQAADKLAGAMENVPPLVLVGFDDLDCAQERLFARLAKHGDVVRFDDGCRAPFPHTDRATELEQLLTQLFKPVVGGSPTPAGALHFLLPAGRYATPALVLRCTVDAVTRELAEARTTGRIALPVIVTAHNPRALFDSVANGLLSCEIDAAVTARRAFADTAFGRAFLALLSCMYDETYLISQASDFALSPFSGLSAREACDLDASWRADRRVDRGRIMSDLAAKSEGAAEVLTALEADDMDGALAAFEQRIRHHGDFDPAFRVEQMAAASCAREFATSCAQVGVAPLEARSLLEQITVSASVRTGEVGKQDACDPAVIFMSLADCAERAACSCSTLIVCDLETTSYPVKAQEDGCTLLMENLELRQPVDALARARYQFFRALSTARDQVVCERVLNTEDASESYPAVMYEELLDCYRGSPDIRETVDRATGLPLSLVPFATTAGEEALQANLTLTDESVDSAHTSLTWDIPASGAVSGALRSRIVLPRPDAPEGSAPLLSPSAIESYLECPYKWFALRRLRVSELDAGFGPMEMGSFSHAVLKSFYERFQEAGHAKVVPETLAVARDMLGTVFDERLAAQPTLKPRDNPLIACTKLEEADIENVRRNLMAFLDREAYLLPGFVPTQFEFDFGTDKPFEYAGCLLRGSVDRIDVNDRGQAVVIDYKGSVGDDYALSSASPAAQAGATVLPHKVQALVYAQVVRRLLGLDVVGALYVSYSKPKVAGAVDRTVLGETAVPGLSIKACGVPGLEVEGLVVESFGDLVDTVESRIALAARELLAGRIAPDPRGDDPCTYCPVLACEKRRAKR